MSAEQSGNSRNADGVAIRTAAAPDVPAIVALLTDDPLGATRESGSGLAYSTSFEAIDADPNNALWVADLDGEVVGVFQLTFIPNLTYTGGWRAQVEGVRVAPSMRGTGLGRRMIEHAIDLAIRIGLDLLRAEHRGGCQFLVDRGKETNIAFLQVLRRTPQFSVVCGQW